MIEHQHTVAGDPVVIRVVENEDDLEGFRDFIRANLGCLGLDSETTGLDIFNDGFRCRLVQFGNTREAWVVPVELGPRFTEDVRLALRGVQRFVLHNAMYDLQVFEQTLGVPMEELWPKVTDTRILAHLVDPRGREEGGIGQGLEALTREHIDEDVANNVKTLMKKLREAHKTTNANVWKKVLLDDPDYQLYSGMDPILACRLLSKLVKLLPAESDPLIAYEHRLAEVCSYMERTGFLVDVEYSEKLSKRLYDQQIEWENEACAYGCDSVNSTEEVADVLEGMGVKILGRTPSGKRQVNEALLMIEAEKGNQFAVAIMNSKRAKKWRRTWVDTFLLERDSSDRCHASINPLRARTARMSITGIPAQTLPSGDSMIRRCFLADEGHRIASVDYQAQELRVLAALSGDRTMIRAFAENADLHKMTAAAAFNVPMDAVTKEQRGYAKVVNFGRVYGGGAKTVAAQTGLSVPQAAKVVAGFDRAYPRVKELSYELQREASQVGYITTHLFEDGIGGGRRLPVDADRAYSALNYLIQSTSRDVTGRALLRLYDAGFGPYLRLPIHDEVLVSVPAGRADWGAAEIGRIMQDQIGPVIIGTDAEVGARSWGSLYCKPDHPDYY